MRSNGNHEKDDLVQIRAWRVLVLLSMRLGVQTRGSAAGRVSR
jgi:hypothetical protein